MKKEKPWWKPWALPSLLLLLAVGFDAVMRSHQPPPFSYSEFREAVTQGKVESVIVSLGHIDGRFKLAPGEERPRTFSTVRVEDPELLRELSARGVKVTGALPDSPWLTWGMWLLPLGLLIFLSLTRRTGDVGAGGYLAVGRSKAKVYVEKDIPVRFSEVCPSSASAALSSWRCSWAWAPRA